MYGPGINPKIDEMLMMRPLPCLRMCGRTALVIRMTPNTLMSKSFCVWAIEFSSLAPARPIPALLTSTSIRPNCAITASTAEATDSSRVTSRSMNVTPWLWSSPAVLRLVPTTWNPASIKARAANLPRPELAPVTSATGREVAIRIVS
jgi:hypothetical protein